MRPMKVKIFIGTKDLESEINRWLSGNPTIAVVYVTQSESDGSSGFGITITIFYTGDADD